MSKKLEGALRRQIKELEKLVELKDRRIAELEKLTIPVSTPISVPFVQPTQIQPFIVTCQHEYPSPWFGITPPSCKKCGQPAFQTVVTCGVSEGNV